MRRHAILPHIAKVLDVKYTVLNDGQIIQAVGNEFMESQYNKLVQRPQNMRVLTTVRYGVPNGKLLLTQTQYSTYFMKRVG